MAVWVAAVVVYGESGAAAGEGQEQRGVDK